jgi:hypothetical protein
MHLPALLSELTRPLATNKKIKSMSNSLLAQEVATRRTFAIISHPDAVQPFNA